jgi:polysaccharide pyruvyl transferase WcaK-like protein
VTVVGVEAPDSPEIVDILVVIIRLASLLLIMIFLRLLSRLHINLAPRISVINEILAADIIVELNFGDILTDAHYARTLWIFNILRLAVLGLSKKPLYMFPQSIGPFKSMINRTLARIILNHARIVAIRDKYSMVQFMNLGIRKDKIRFVPDTSFFSPMVSRSEASKILRDEGFIEEYNRAMVGIVVSPKFFDFRDFHRTAVTLRRFVNAVDSLVKEFHAKVIFIPHDTSVHENSLDCRQLSFLIKRMLKNEDYATVLTKEYTVEELWGIIGLCDVIISMMTHPIIASLRAGVPSVAIAYSHKTLGVIEPFGVGEYVFDLETFLMNKGVKAVSELLKQGDAIGQRLKMRVQSAEAILAKFQQEFSKDVARFVQFSQ